MATQEAAEELEVHERKKTKKSPSKNPAPVRHKQLEEAIKQASDVILAPLYSR